MKAKLSYLRYLLRILLIPVLLCGFLILGEKYQLSGPLLTLANLVRKNPLL